MNTPHESLSTISGDEVYQPDFLLPEQFVSIISSREDVRNAIQLQQQHLQEIKTHLERAKEAMSKYKDSGKSLFIMISDLVKSTFPERQYFS